MRDNKLWVFLHAPRTGGTTVLKYIMQTAPRGEILIPSNVRYGFEKKSFDKSKIKYILGHASYYGIDKEFPKKETFYFTFLRDPAARIISLYNEKFKDYPKSKVIPFDKWYTSQPKNELVRFYGLKSKGSESSHIKIPRFISPLVKLFKGKYKMFNFILTNFRRIQSPLSEKDLNKAKNLLDKCYFVGIIENAKEDSKFLFDLMNLNCPEWKYSSTYKKKLVTTTDEIRKKIYKDNPLDYELYRYAWELNKKQKETLGLEMHPQKMKRSSKDKK